jgi:AcrR family transcriptional regulator
MNRKEEILLTVKEMMIHEGIDASFTMASLAKRLDIGKSTIYEYFQNKDELLKDALLMIIDEYVEEILQFEDLDEYSFEQAMKMQLERLMSKAYLSRMTLETFTKEHIHHIPPMYKDELQKQMQEIKERMAQRFIYLFEKALNEGVADESKMLSNEDMIGSLVMGAIFKYIDEAEGIDLKPYVDKLYNTLLLLI